MRDLLLILREAAAEPLTRDELLEAVAVAESYDAYGYWITPEGHAHEVESMHFVTLNELETGLTNSSALKQGWIKVIAEDGFTADLYAGCTTEDALATLRNIAENFRGQPFRLNVSYDDTLDCVSVLSEAAQQELFSAQCVETFDDVAPFVAQAYRARRR